jgi:hypothetical protein
MQILFSFCRKCVIRHFIEVYKMIEHISMDIPQNISKYTFEDPTCYHKYKPIPYDCSLYIVWSISTDSINYLSLIIIYVLFKSKTNKAQSASRRYEGTRLIYFYCPALSHNYNLQSLPRMFIFLLKKSIPTVGYIW